MAWQTPFNLFSHRSRANFPHFSWIFLRFSSQVPQISIHPYYYSYERSINTNSDADDDEYDAEDDTHLKLHCVHPILHLKTSIIYLLQLLLIYKGRIHTHGGYKLLPRLPSAHIYTQIHSYSSLVMLTLRSTLKFRVYKKNNRQRDLPCRISWTVAV